MNKHRSRKTIAGRACYATISDKINPEIVTDKARPAIIKWILVEG